ncbi:hypothetical protein EBV26_17630 [bacterium]|nr:hypothetical protein [bacterium]
MGICLSKKECMHDEPVQQPLREQENEEPFDHTKLRIKIPKDPYHVDGDKKTPWESSPREWAPPPQHKVRVAIRRVRSQIREAHSA